MQAYCFRFYFLLVTVIILGGMVPETRWRSREEHSGRFKSAIMNHENKKNLDCPIAVQTFVYVVQRGIKTIYLYSGKRQRLRIGPNLFQKFNVFVVWSIRWKDFWFGCGICLVLADATRKWNRPIRRFWQSRISRLQKRDERESSSWSIWRVTSTLSNNRMLWRRRWREDSN